MNLVMWTVVLFGAFYSFGHAFYLIKDKNKFGAIGISLVGVIILICPFLVRMK
ncbi:hypothetical protein [Neobacillus sp. D3-1R]|uniref:hypothetical protein n=1 Tax=Neobacillus sp. D3-1R TaxID=3445778 RepID=UPI003FA08D44